MEEPIASNTLDQPGLGLPPASSSLKLHHQLVLEWNMERSKSPVIALYLMVDRDSNSAIVDCDNSQYVKGSITQSTIYINDMLYHIIDA